MGSCLGVPSALQTVTSPHHSACYSHAQRPEYLGLVLIEANFVAYCQIGYFNQYTKYGRGFSSLGVHLQDGISRGQYHDVLVVEDEDPSARQ